MCYLVKGWKQHGKNYQKWLLYYFGTISMDRKYYGILVTASYRRAVLFFYRLVPANIGKTDFTKRYGTGTGRILLLCRLVTANISKTDCTKRYSTDTGLIPLNGIRY